MNSIVTRNFFRKMITGLPFGNHILNKYWQMRQQMFLRKLGTTENVFRYIYNNNWWINDESASGPGSTIKSTENIRKEIPNIIETYGITRILDAPCGDYNWFRLIPRSSQIVYIGGDIVSELVEKTRSQYENSNTRFMKLDITQDPLPDADLWLCRDCFIHLSHTSIFRSLNIFLNSNIKYLLTTTFPEHKRNQHTVNGGDRQINLEEPPFNLTKAIQYIDDWKEGSPVRKLGLWKKEMIISSLSTNKTFKKIVHFKQ